MAFLRSQKFFRFLSVGKNIINFRDYDATQQIPQQFVCDCSAQNFATASAIKSNNQNLENQLKRLDQDVRRSGRISRRDLEEILEEIRSNKSPTSSQSLLVIRCCGNLVPEEKPEVRTKIVQEIWKTLTNLNIPMDISHYNALLRVYLENEYDFSPTEFLAELHSKGVEPNRVTYQRLISRYCQQGDIDGATQILEFMREKQLPVNENVFNALIMGHSNADDIESAAGIIGVMTHAGLEPSADTYTTLLCGYARQGDVDSINKYIEICKEKEIHLLDKDFLEIVYSLSINNHEDKIEIILDKLKKSVGYNQDAVNVILRLANKGKIKTAIQILKSMPRSTRMDGELADTGNFFIRQLVKGDQLDQILDVCSELESSNMHTKPILIALEEAFKQSNIQIAKGLLLEMKKKGNDIRQHYFWPLIGSAKNQEEAFNVVNFMINEFNQELSGQTIRDYIIPKLTDKNYDKMILALRNLGISPATACSCVSYFAVKKDDLADAARIMNSFDAYFSPGLFKKPLLFALTSKRDYENYVKCIRSIHDGVPRLQNLNSRQIKEAEEDNNEGETIIEEDSKESRIDKLQADIVGSFVVDALINIRQNKLEVVEKILERLVMQGLSITNSKAEIIQNRIGDQMTDEISTLLAKVTSGDLEPIPMEKRKQKFTNANLNPEALERLITRLDEKGENSKGIKKQLLIQSIRSKDLEKTEKLVEKFKEEGYTLTNGVHALLLELYASNNKAEEACKIFNQIKSEDQEFELDDIKTIKLIQALVNNDKIEDAIKFLEENKRTNLASNGFQYNITCWRLLNTLAEKGETDKVNSLFDALTANNYASPNNVLLGPLIKVHMVKNEVKEAIDKFEEICRKYRATPWKNELSCKLIQMEDAVSLQRVTDLSTEVHGEVNSLYDLVFSFIECGRTRQARKILETPGLRTRNYNRFLTVCERYAEEGKPTVLEGLIEATKDLNHIDRSEICYNLMETYIKDKSLEKCHELWTKMQEEDITASDSFMIKLANFLKSQDAEIPFVVPEIQKSEQVLPKNIKISTPKTEKLQKTQQQTTKVSNHTIDRLKEDIKKKNAAGIEAFIQNQDNLNLFGSLTVLEKSKVIEALVKDGRMNDANNLVLKMLNDKTYPRLNIFKFYLNKLAGNGDIATMQNISNHLDSEIKKELSFDNRFCHGFVGQGKAEEYLKILENTIESAKTPEEVQKAGEVFPRGGAIGLLESCPEFTKRYEEIARKYAEQNILGPINVLWIHNFINGNHEQSDKLWKEYLSAAPRLMFQRIVQVAREKSDENLIVKLLSLLKNGTNVSEGAIGNVYSALIDIQTAKADVSLILNSIKEAVDTVCLENINVTALSRAKKEVEKAGQNFPYKIPEKKSRKQDESSSSSSSSSSDDDVKGKNRLV